jgi:DNA-binding IclR family transcriptional regulator
MTVAALSEAPETGIEDANVSSIAKGLRVLRALAEECGGEAGVSDLATAAALPKSTTHRVLAMLLAEGFASRNGQRYQLGPRWFGLQAAVVSSSWQRLSAQCRVPMAVLFERTEATVHLGVADGREVLYLEKLTARGGTTIPTRVGARMPMTCTAVGKVLLAWSEPTLIDEVVRSPLRRLTRASITGPGLLCGQLEEVRGRGLAFDREESQPGVHCVAAPLRRDGRVVAAVSISRVGTGGLARDDAAVVQAAAGKMEAWLSGDD